MGMSNEMRSLVESFVAKVEDVSRRESAERVMRALGSASAHDEPNGHSSNGNGHARKAVTGKSGQKRDPKVLAETVQKLGEYIQSHPGQGVEQIRVALNRTTSELALPMQKLLTSRVITKKGQKRATKYFPSGIKAKA